MRAPADRDMESKAIVATVRAAAKGNPFRRLSSVFAATASRSALTRARGTPRGYPPACHTGLAGDGTDSAKRTYVPRPPPPQAAAVSRSAHCEEWENVTSSQSSSDPLGIVGTI